MTEPRQPHETTTDRSHEEDESLARESGASAGVEAFAAETASADALPVVAPDEMRQRWLRAEADLQNFRRRAQRDREESVRAAEDRLLLEMVGVLDDLERALAATVSDPAAAAWSQGVTLTAHRLRDAMARSGVEVIEAVGARFDPAIHEALLEVDAPEGIAPGHVAQEVLRGYRRGDRALRASRVVVARQAGDA